MKISNNFGSWIGGVSEPEIAGSTPREDPADGTPRKKARSGEAAVDCTKAVAAIKGGREAETLKEEADDAGVDDDEVMSGGSHDHHRRGRRRQRRGSKRQAPPSHHDHDRRRRGQLR